MINKLCLFILLIVFSCNGWAEYYLVYEPPQCVNCVNNSFAPIKYRRHHKMKRYPVQRQRNSCGECAECICGPGYAVSTSQPRYYGEYCTTYDDVVQGGSSPPSYY